VMAPFGMLRALKGEERGEGEPEWMDEGLRECESRWVKAFAQNWVSHRIGHGDWGNITVQGAVRALDVTVESYEVVERLREILEAVREVMARLRYRYVGWFSIQLRVPPPEPTAAQRELQQKFNDQQDDWYHEQLRREKAEYMERLHQMELKKQQGAEINPEEFSPEPKGGPPPPPWEVEEEEDEEDGPGDTVVKKKPDPPPSFFDDEHPLAENYNMWGAVTLEEAWFDLRHQGLSVHLMGQEPDKEIPDEKRPE